jgi:predicted nucleotide-binding protein
MEVKMVTKPKFFIGSSQEGLDVAYALQYNLDNFAEVTVWDQGVFQLSEYTLQSLCNILEKSDYGIFVFTPDDISKIRDETFKTVRDNVLFELGLCMGRLGKDRTFIIFANRFGWTNSWKLRF